MGKNYIFVVVSTLTLVPIDKNYLHLVVHASDLAHFLYWYLLFPYALSSFLCFLSLLLLLTCLLCGFLFSHLPPVISPGVIWSLFHRCLFWMMMMTSEMGFFVPIQMSVCSSLPHARILSLYYVVCLQSCRCQWEYNIACEDQNKPNRVSHSRMYTSIEVS